MKATEMIESFGKTFIYANYNLLDGDIDVFGRLVPQLFSLISFILI